ncbi:MAG: hypothetical protein HZA17_09230 [Nitrospirae bacterium]|nr:hypothetical protein [Nitrospirota bacterium]
MVFIAELRGKLRSDLWKYALSYAVALIVTSLTVTNYVKIQNTLAPLYPKKEIYKKSIDGLAESFVTHEQYCLGGYSTGDIVEAYTKHMQHFLLQWDHICAQGDKRLPLYVTSDNNGEIWLSELQITGVKTKELHPALMGKVDSAFRVQNGKYISVRPVDGRSIAGGEGLMMSGEVYENCDFEISMENFYHGGVFFGYENTENFMLIAITIDGYVWGQIISNGLPSGQINRLPLLLKDLRSFHLSARYVGKDLYLFKDTCMLTIIPDAANRRGKIGFFSTANLITPPVFSNIKVASVCEVNNGKAVFIPRVKNAVVQ